MKDDKAYDTFEMVFLQRFSPEGDMESLIYMTTAEICYIFEDMVMAGVLTVSSVLRDNGFTTKLIDGTVYWALYEKES